VKYLIFLNYLIRHKWYVFVECCRYGVPWRGISHDMSKFFTKWVYRICQSLLSH